MDEEKVIYHPPVMVKEVVELIKANSGGIFIDATVGGGGHARAILEANKENRVVGIDRDEIALQIAEENLKEFEGRFSLYHAPFSMLDEVAKLENLKEVDGILFDLGVSHFQLRGERGFSVWKEEPLDMRMDRRQKLSAKDVVNTLEEKEIARILKEFGEEPLARKIAKEIVKFRKKKTIETTKELADIVVKVYGKRVFKKHPAIRTFQAIRIYVNKELEELKTALPKAVKLLKPSGRLVVISFHSLEDRIVKNLPKHCKDVRPVFKKPLTPSEEEIKNNPASRSAKLRVYEKV